MPLEREIRLVITLEREIRLVITLALCAIIFAMAHRMFRRRGRPTPQAASDALLVFFLCQYLSVVIPGVLGVLSPWTIGISSALFAGGLWFLGNVPAMPSPCMSRRDAYVFALSLGVAIGYAGGYAYVVRWLPVVSNDALTYHFPAAVQWLQDHRLGIYSAWYYNPANTYSPLGGSTFIAWWMGLTGDDVLARYTQFPPLILIGLASFNLFRRLRCPVIPSSLLMAAVMVCNPILSQAMMGKDDLYLVGFFACTVVAFARRRDAIQAAVAVGLMLACKMTALLMLPVLLLMASRRMRWKHWIALSIGAMLIAGPWYIRNWILTGNPVFPVDFLFWNGLAATRPAPQLGSVQGIITVLFRGTYAIPPVVGALLFLGWLAGVVRFRRMLLRSGLARIVFIGPWLGLALYLLSAPFAEMRFVLPLVVLMFAACSIAVVSMRRNRILQSALASIILIACAVTAFYLNEGSTIVEFLIVAVGCTGVAGAIVAARAYRPLLAVTGTALFVVLVYVRWNSYVDELKLDASPLLLANTYGRPTVDAWMFVEKSVPPGETIAYANTFYVYPLMGSTQQRRIAHAPTRPGLRFLHDLPRIGGRLTGEELAKAARSAQVASPDESTWLQNLRDTHATHLIVFLQSGTDAAPELAFAAKRPGTFSVVFRNEVAVVYRINW